MTTKRCPGLVDRPAHDAPLAEFTRDVHEADGRERYCRDCRMAYGRVHRTLRALGLREPQVGPQRVLARIRRAAAG